MDPYRNETVIFIAREKDNLCVKTVVKHGLQEIEALALGWKLVSKYKRKHFAIIQHTNQFQIDNFTRPEASGYEDNS